MSGERKGWYGRRDSLEQLYVNPEVPPARFGVFGGALLRRALLLRLCFAGPVVVARFLGRCRQRRPLYIGRLLVSGVLQVVVGVPGGLFYTCSQIDSAQLPHTAGDRAQEKVEDSTHRDKSNARPRR
jgi:hypothetical protein